MKFINHLFPFPINILPSQSSNQTQVTQPLPPLRKKALLIGIGSTFGDKVDEITLKDLHWRHRNVLDMEQLLIGALYHDNLFLLLAKRILAVV